MDINTVVQNETASIFKASPVKATVETKEVVDKPIVATAITGAKEAVPMERGAKQEQEASKRAEVDNALQNISSFFNHELNFEVDQKSNKIVVKFIDPKTGDVIKQIPSEEAIAISERLNDTKGVLVDMKE